MILEHPQNPRARSAAAAKRLIAYVKTTDGVPPQVALDVGILAGRLSLYEGKGWLETEEQA